MTIDLENLKRFEDTYSERGVTARHDGEYVLFDDVSKELRNETAAADAPLVPEQCQACHGTGEANLSPFTTLPCAQCGGTGTSNVPVTGYKGLEEEDAPLVPDLGTDSPQHLLDVYPTLAVDLAADDRFVAAFEEARGEMSFSDILKMASIEKLEAETDLIRLRIAERSPKTLRAAFNAVRKFHITFGHPAPSAPQMQNPDRAHARCDWISEEVGELEQAETLTEQADAYIDIIYFALGGLVELGIDPSPVFDLVQKANMAKVWADGKPRFREDGKIIKPEGWVAPDAAIKAEIERQIVAGGVV